MIQNTWSTEAKILQIFFEVQASIKVRFLQRNDKMPRIKNFYALKMKIKVRMLTNFHDFLKKFQNIVEESLFGKDPDVAEDMYNAATSTDAIGRMRQRNEICVVLLNGAVFAITLTLAKMWLK